MKQNKSLKASLHIIAFCLWFLFQLFNFDEMKFMGNHNLEKFKAILLNEEYKINVVCQQISCQYIHLLQIRLYICISCLNKKVLSYIITYLKSIIKRFVTHMLQKILVKFECQFEVFWNCGTSIRVHFTLWQFPHALYMLLVLFLFD